MLSVRTATMVAPIVFVWVLLWLNLHCHASPAERLQEADLTFMAFLVSHEQGVYGVVCSGTIIHESFVLTAANCFYSSTGEPISYQHKVLIASDYKDILRLIPNPRYFLQTWANDLGLIELAEKLVFGPYVSKMRLAQADDLQVHNVAYTTCWITNNKQSSFQEGPVIIEPKRHCGRPPYYGRYITKNMSCTTANNTCTVNSGAPLLKGGRQHGIASWQNEQRVLFTKIFGLRWWIANTVFAGHMDEYFAQIYV